LAWAVCYAKPPYGPIGNGAAVASVPVAADGRYQLTVPARSLATGIRLGHRQTPARRQYGLCHGLGNRRRFMPCGYNSPESAELRTFLIKLSGRQMRYKQDSSNPALLAGLWVFLSMSKIMEAYSQEELEALKATARQFLGIVV